jgi:hypothetical protein
MLSRMDNSLVTYSCPGPVDVQLQALLMARVKWPGRQAVHSRLRLSRAIPLLLYTFMVRDQLHDPSTLNPRKKLPVPCALVRILGGPHSRSRNNSSSAPARHWSPVARPLLVTGARSGPTRRMGFWNFSVRNRHAPSLLKENIQLTVTGHA